MSSQEISEKANGIKATIDSIMNQYKENYKMFSLSLPTAFVLIPLYLFLLSPDSQRGIFLFGAIMSSIIALIFTPVTNPDNFLNNYPSFPGIVLGYVVGYLMMENIHLSQLGSMLSTIVMGSIFAILLCVSIFDENDVYFQILNVGIGWLIGMAIGMIFSYASIKDKEQKDKYELLESKEKESKH
tara:strand:- start:5891 stop:6445 length:555 start_codon:yes stop_codon:yes gene_type:complete